jgi:hypothetical protein
LDGDIMMKKLTIYMFLSGYFVAVLGCGGGGGGASSTTNAQPATTTPPTTTTPTTAVLTLKTSGTASASYKGIELTVNLPAGVIVKTDPANPNQTAPGVFKLSGVFSPYSAQILPRPFFGRYSSAGAGKPSTVTVAIASGSATFPVGEFATLTCDLSGVSTASLSDFSVVNFAAYGAGGANVAGLTASPLGVTLR